MGANEKHEATYHGGEYTPDTTRVRHAYVDHVDYSAQLHGLTSDDKYAGEDFDRWLETVRAEAKAEALNEAADDFESNVGAGEFTEQSRDGETYWRHTAEAWEAQGPYMQWLRNRAKKIREQP